MFVYCAIFPFFNNVDEPYHFDLVVKYAHGEIPRRIVPISQESARFIILYGTPEYLSGPAKFPNGKISPPTWTYPADQIAVALPIALARWRDEPNHEATEPPLYYAIGAVWYRLGRVLGIEGGFLLYWIRFLNPLLAAALVWIGFHAAREACPEATAGLFGRARALGRLSAGYVLLNSKRCAVADRFRPGFYRGAEMAADGCAGNFGWPFSQGTLAVAGHSVKAAN